jgi:hypothetical protein
MAFHLHWKVYDLLLVLQQTLQDKRVTTAEVLDHPWLSIALTPEQQDSWAKLQEEQQALDAQLQAASNPRLVSYNSLPHFCIKHAEVSARHLAGSIAGFACQHLIAARFSHQASPPRAYCSDTFAFAICRPKCGEKPCLP